MNTEAELLSCFREIDRGEVELSDDFRFPLDLEDALAWAVGPRVFLLFRERPDARPRGIVFRKNPGPAPDVVAMCEWCHSVRGHGGVKLMSARTDERRSVGLYLCSDLACVSRSREVPGTDDIPDRLNGPERARRTLERISAFAARAIF